MSKKSSSVNTLRPGPYSKLISRFYEPLILLTALGKTRGAHLPAPYDSTTLQLKRRRLLRNLSYLCDYEKGGDTTCSIGIEEREECFNIWVASNRAKGVETMVSFLKPALGNVKRIIGLDKENRKHEEEEFIRNCIEFAKSRVRKEIRMFITAMKRFKACLDRNQIPTDADLMAWVDRFDLWENYSIVEACHLAYKERKAPQLERLSDIVNKHLGPSVSADAFKEFRHYLGRLAHHVRAPKQVLEDAPELDRLFDEYHVYPVAPKPSNPRPLIDRKTTLSSMLVRMLPTGDPRLPGYQESLDALDKKLGILNRVHDRYTNKNFKPIVHAEILVLEHFYQGQRTFVDNDKYIGCSKPACYCCHLYFRHHPSRPVEPESHQNVYPNWGVPALDGGTEDPRWIPQRDLLIKILEPIRLDALDQISRRANPCKRHADSMTGITMSTLALSLDPGAASIGETPCIRRVFLTRKLTLPKCRASQGLDIGANPQLDPLFDIDSASEKNSIGSPPELLRDYASDCSSDSDGGAAL
ncbi:hypothetical protein F4809DRAFT_652023 [Biscogniauxia mediterranea]|nr:hypothetical protein F4809DRAFT_652023 [Biscogniauxia mediterranea]